MIPLTEGGRERSDHSYPVRPKEAVLAFVMFVLHTRRKDPFNGQRSFWQPQPALEDITLRVKNDITLSLLRRRLTQS